MYGGLWYYSHDTTWRNNPPKNQNNAYFLNFSGILMSVKGPPAKSLQPCLQKGIKQSSHFEAVEYDECVYKLLKEKCDSEPVLSFQSSGKDELLWS